MVAGRWRRRNDGGQFTATRCGPQGRHQERCRPSAPAASAARARGPRRDPARRSRGRIIRPRSAHARPRKGGANPRGRAAASRTDDARNRPRPQSGGGVSARGRARHRAVRRGGHRERRAADRDACSAPRTLASRSSRCRAPTWTGCQRQRFAPGRRPAGAAVSATRIPTTCSKSARHGVLARAAGGAGQHLRSAQPRRDRAVGGGLRRPRRVDPAAPQRRVTAVAWRTSAGAAARLPVARATNLTRTLKDWAATGLQVVGLDADGDTTLDEFDGTGRPSCRGGLRGQGPVASGPRKLRCDPVHPDGRSDRIAQRLGRRGRGAGRHRPPAQPLMRCQSAGTDQVPSSRRPAHSAITATTRVTGTVARARAG